MQKETLQLDASMLAGRMRSHNRRQVERVQPRGSARHLQKLANTDVWVPTNLKVITAVSENHSAVIKKGAQDEGRTTSISVPQTKLRQPASQIDFAKKASEWIELQKSTQKQKNYFKFRLDSSTVLTSMAILVFIFGIAAALHSFRLDKQITASVAANEAGPQDVHEVKPTQDDLYHHKVSPENPRFLRIPKFNVNARVVSVGTNSSGEMDAPKNIHDVGWFKESVLPGNIGGVSVFDGHVSGPTQPGVFKELGNLSKGDVIEVEKGNGEKINYVVVKTEIADASKVDMSQLLLPVTPGKHGLNLISCAGRYDAQTKQFEKRVLVFAEVVR